jgi:hypothetical protein
MREERQMAPRGRFAVAAVIAAAAVGGGIAAAAGVTLPFSGDGNTINGCYSSGGALKVLTPSEPTCPKGYAPIQWNQTGPQGPAGPQGATGPQGQAATLGNLTTVVVDDTIDIGAFGDADHVEVDCPAGTVGTGGGAAAGGNVDLEASNPILSGGSMVGWIALGQGGTFLGGELTVWAVCLKLK